MGDAASSTQQQLEQQQLSAVSGLLGVPILETLSQYRDPTWHWSIYYSTQEVAKNLVMQAEFVLWLPLFSSSAFVPLLGTLSCYVLGDYQGTAAPTGKRFVVHDTHAIMTQRSSSSSLAPAQRIAHRNRLR
jgi:hypothetical protein